MLAADGTARLRCCLGTPSGQVYTDPVQVTRSLTVNEPVSEARLPRLPVGDPLRAAVGEEEPSTCLIVINYLFDNNAIAFEPYGASVATGSDFKATIPSPEVVGYAPFRRVGDSYVDASVVEFDLTDIRSNIIINVIYEPALVEFSVHHHLQNILDDEYSVHYDLITTGKALTGSIVGDGLALTEEQLPGFKALAYEKLPVAADSSTVIEIRYDRNYYLVDFDMNGGYGTDPVYTTYILGEGAFDYCDCGAAVPSEIYRDPTTAGGQNMLITRQRKLFAPRGFSFVQPSTAIVSPTDVQLATAARWTPVKDTAGSGYFDSKAMPFARILSEG
jgi:hypothetical protein